MSEECPYLSQCNKRKDIIKYITDCSGKHYGLCKDFQEFRKVEYEDNILRFIEQDEVDLKVGRLESIGEEVLT